MQVDELLFAAAGHEEVEAAVKAINRAFEGIGMFKQVRVCQGNYAAGEDYDGQIGHRYFDLGNYPADLLVGIDCDALMTEYDYTGACEGLMRNQQMAVGAADVIDREVESPEKIIERIEAQKWLSPEQTLITSSCGLNICLARPPSAS